MDPNNGHAATKYLHLKPQEASIRDILRIIFCAADVRGNDNFLELVNVKQSIAERTRIIGLSMLVQKGLQFKLVNNLISLFGYGFETCLNVLGNRRNFRMVLKNLLRGKVTEALPSRESANFISTIGHLDKRVELDKNIEPGTNKYFASLSAMASKLAYENKEFIKLIVEKQWKMELLGADNFWNERHQRNATQAFWFHDKTSDPDTIVVAFRGTEPFNAEDWSTDVDLSWYKFPGIKGRVHGGFMKALGLKLNGTWPKNITTDGHKNAYNAITEDLKRRLEINQRTKFIVTGHSLGGALAILFPAVLAMHGEIHMLKRLQAVFTFGQPRVGDEKFGRFMKGKFGEYGVEYCRFVYSHDIVPRVPKDDSALMFKHFGACVYINTLYEGKVVEEVPYKNYFDWGEFVAKRADAMWELVRSFLLPQLFGPDYQETLLQRMFRMVGLLVPGLPAHGPQDYINATRLATY